MIKIKLSILALLFLISCSKENSDETTPIRTYKLTVFAVTGGTVTYDNPNDGQFEAGSQVVITPVADENYFFIGWTDGSRDNPLTLTLDNNIEIAPKFLNKQDLITRFQEIVIGDGENGPMDTRKWKEMKVFLDGNPSDQFKNELVLFLEELNTVLENDNSFSSIQVNDKSSSNVHMFFTDADSFKEIYPEYEDIELEKYWGYASWSSDFNGYINEGLVFINGPEMTENSSIVWTIRHELGHILGLKHTTDKTSIMNPIYYVGQNDVYSDLDKEALRFLHDQRMPMLADVDESREILENILGVSNSSKISITSKRPTKLNLHDHNILAVCGRIKSNTISK